MPALAADPTIRRQVVSVAREVLARDASAPVAVIANRAGVSRATFYRHFGSREALLRSVALEPPPDARARILAAARDMLVTSSLAELSMEQLAKAAGVSRGTLYRIVPGKGALLGALIEAYSPFESIRSIITEHRDGPPDVVLPLIGRAIAGVAGERFGLMRAVFHEVTSGSEPAMAGIRPLFAETIGLVAAYMARQMEGGRLRRMHPILALQSVIGPLFFHVMTRPTVERVVGLDVELEAAVDRLVLAALEGLRP
ncbi:MAG TPA: TetR/AcrR family transcriptional regulator [Candidatus Binatia bacterium]|nr:TetR/AcrR family transcriptional regulator [Candidatus Binatia bacterium]